MSRRLYRSRTDRVLAGVAGGIARYFDVDAAIVRLVWLALVLAGGSGVLVYIIAAFIIPSEPGGADDDASHHRPGASTAGAVLLIGVGALLLLRTHMPVRLLAGWALPLLLILLGIVLLMRDR